MSWWLIILLGFGAVELLCAINDLGKPSHATYNNTYNSRAKANIVTVVIIFILVAGSHGVFS